MGEMPQSDQSANIVWPAPSIRTYPDVSVVCAGAGLAVIGMLVRLGAHWSAWPQNVSYSGPVENTEWYATEMAYRDVSIFLMASGLLTLLVGLTFLLRRINQA